MTKNIYSEKFITFMKQNAIELSTFQSFNRDTRLRMSIQDLVSVCIHLIFLFLFLILISRQPELEACERRTRSSLPAYWAILGTRNIKRVFPRTLKNTKLILSNEAINDRRTCVYYIFEYIIIMYMVGI